MYVLSAAADGENAAEKYVQLYFGAGVNAENIISSLRYVLFVSKESTFFRYHIWMGEKENSRDRLYAAVTFYSAYAMLISRTSNRALI